ncbi:3-mercaptopyruvate sulfurtransferase [Altererythrobacter sp. ZODW24]|uniref:3-mercaptopyruvate sulfurtransferase n=1 Tax=Altererythrobacter sp. ZODW24 TaxID=2185142 RepID=UPI000DF7AC4A|nr:3-mercaptopyruvate sulfurtransferase [Altererythrobacter sp. ZODW24]
MDRLVTPEWLEEEMGASDLRIVDASMHMAGNGRDAKAEYEAEHIPGAVFMDLASLRNADGDFGHALSKPEQFASRMQGLGLGDGSRIVVYDDSDIKTAARAWVMFKTFGAHHVAILDGGLAKWKAEGRLTESGIERLRHRHYTAWEDTQNVRSKADMLANLDSGAEQVVDARGAPRFTGEMEEPREGMSAGHIPGAMNVPFTKLYNEDGTFKSEDDLRAVFAEAGVDLDRPVVTSCGSGVTASVVLFALVMLGKQDLALYDGSWAEWGADPDTPKATGPA